MNKRQRYAIPERNASAAWEKIKIKITQRLRLKSIHTGCVCYAAGKNAIMVIYLLNGIWLGRLGSVREVSK